MLRHMEGDLDGERARVLSCIDDGNDTRADGNQCQCDLVQRTVEVAWRKEQRKRGKKINKTQVEVRKRLSSGILARRRLSGALQRNAALNKFTLSPRACCLNPSRRSLIPPLIYEFNLSSSLTDTSKRLLGTFASSRCKGSPAKTTRPAVIYGLVAARKVINRLFWLPSGLQQWDVPNKMSHLNSACWCPSLGRKVGTFTRQRLAALVKVQAEKKNKQNKTKHFGSQEKCDNWVFIGKMSIGIFFHYFKTCANWELGCQTNSRSLWCGSASSLVVLEILYWYVWVCLFLWLLIVL